MVQNSPLSTILPKSGKIATKFLTIYIKLLNKPVTGVELPLTSPGKTPTGVLKFSGAKSSFSTHQVKVDFDYIVWDFDFLMDIWNTILSQNE